MTKKRRLGYFRKNSFSSKELRVMFELNQAKRYYSVATDWEDKKFLSKLNKEEGKARKVILSMLRKGKIKTADDCFRAGHFFHHSDNFRDYALAIALFASSHHLGEAWGRNWSAVALDRFLLAIKQPQFFGTQFEKRKWKWKLSPYRNEVTDQQRKAYNVDPIGKIKQTIRELEEGDKKNKKNAL